MLGGESLEGIVSKGESGVDGIRDTVRRLYKEMQDWEAAFMKVSKRLTPALIGPIIVYGRHLLYSQSTAGHKCQRPRES